MQTSPKYIFFTDFDGTITTRDSNDFMTDNLGFGQALRKQGNKDVLHGTKTFRDSFQEMMDSIKTPYSKCIQTLIENIKLDPGFKEFFEWARENNMPVVILSGGMEPIIRALLVHLMGEKEASEIQIVSNQVEVREGHKSLDEEGGWNIIFHDERYSFNPHHHKYIGKELTTPIVISDMINPSKLDHMLLFQMIKDQPCFMLEMVYQIFLQQRKRIFFSLRRVMILLLIV